MMRVKQQPSNIPILCRKTINQSQLREQDLDFKVFLDPINHEIRKNKDDRFIIIKTVHVRPNQIIISFQKIQKTRLLRILGQELQHNFVSVKFCTYQTDYKYAKKFLNSSIIINKQQYNFFGYSKTNLKQFSCYFFKASDIEIEQLFLSLGHFDTIFQISKKASRMSLLYSESNFVCQLQNQQIITITDIQKDGQCFTDGCGYISRSLARRIKKHITKTQKQIEYLPSIYQIRIKGIKGVLLLNPNYENEVIVVRNSMIKFDAKQDKLKQLVLINYSKPSNYASLNQQIIMLLSGLGIKSQIFLQLQKKYIKLLKSAIENPVQHIQLLNFLGKQDIVTQILKNQQNIKFRIKSIVSQQIYKNIKSKDMKNRLRIPLQKARFLYGAVYPDLCQSNKQNILNQNQIFLRVTTKKGIVQTIVGKVMVTKNPCYYCGDIRILQAIDISQQFQFANKLVDVIIFSTQGKVPVSTTIAGSDYDGDQYFVCWDQDLIPNKEIQPYNYPMTKAKKKPTKVNKKDIIDYFVYFDRSTVGKINNRFLGFATISDRGVRCKQCVELGTQLFSKAIDSINTGQKVILPDHLKNFNVKEYKDSHVWVKMTKQYQIFFEDQFQYSDELIASWNGWNVTYDMMIDIIQSYVGNSRYNDYILFRIIKSWYLNKKSTNYQLFRYVNFCQLSIKQRKQVQQLPQFPKEEFFKHPFQMSPIFQHYLFKKHDIQFYSYQDMPKKWRPYYKSEENQLNFEILESALTNFHNVLIGFLLNQKIRLVFSFTNMKKYPYFQNHIKAQQMTVYYLGNNQLKQFCIKQPYKQYKLYYSDQLLQIYENKRQNSFFWFKNKQVSIDLTRFDRNMLRKHSKINKENIKYLQIYIGLSENYVEKVESKKLLVGEFPVQIQREDNKQKIDKKQQKVKKYVQKQKKPKYVQKKVEKKKYVQKK